MISCNKGTLRATLNSTASLLVVALLLASVNVQAKEFYRWTDAKGTMHFTDKPPRDIKFDKVKGKNLATDDVKEEANAAANELKDPERCQKEKARLNILKNNKRIQMKNRDGSQHFLSAEEIKAETEQTQKAVSVYCFK